MSDRSKGRSLIHRPLTEKLPSLTLPARQNRKPPPSPRYRPNGAARATKGLTAQPRKPSPTPPTPGICSRRRHRPPRHQAGQPADRRGRQLWVADFGLARFGPDAGLTMTGDLLGTLRTWPRSRRWPGTAWRIIGSMSTAWGQRFTVLTGRPAVGGDEKAEIVRHIAFEEPVCARKLDEPFPRSWRRSR